MYNFPEIGKEQFQMCPQYVPVTKTAYSSVPQSLLFTKYFGEEFGVSPKEFGKGNKGL